MLFKSGMNVKRKNFLLLAFVIGCLVIIPSLNIESATSSINMGKYKVRLYRVDWRGGNDPDGFRVHVEVFWKRLYGHYWGDFSSDYAYDDKQSSGYSVYSGRYYGNSGTRYPNQYTSSNFAFFASDLSRAVQIDVYVDYFNILGAVEDWEKIQSPYIVQSSGSNYVRLTTGWQQLSHRDFDIKVDIIIYLDQSY